MKNICFIISVCLSLFATSCAITEDISLKKNKEVEYSMTIDLSEVLKMANSPDGSSLSFSGIPEMSKDSVINLVEMLKDSMDITAADIREDIDNIRPLYMRMENDLVAGKLALTVFGTFKNDEAFNKAFVSILRLDEYQKVQKGENEEESSNYTASSLFKDNSLFWDGKTMRHLRNSEDDTEAEDDYVGIEELFETEDDEEENESPMQQMMSEMMNPFAAMFSKTKMVTNYHFPKEVKSVSSEDATLSNKGKTVTVIYSGEESLKSKIDYSIEVTTK